MVFFKRKSSTKPSNMVNVGHVYVVTATIVLARKEGDACWVTREVPWYFLAKFENDGYYEFFSGKKLVKKEDIQTMGTVYVGMPYIEKVEPFTDYIKEDVVDKELDIQLLFDFITNMNVQNAFGEGKNA